jgi:replicative DNA helicase
MTALTTRAEEALNAALLADPGLMSAAARCRLSPADFLTRRGARLYGAMEMAAPAIRGETTSAQWREQVTQIASGHGVRSWYLDTVQTACPDPAHGPSYLAMVIEASSRRLLYTDARVTTRVSANTSANAARLARAAAAGGRTLRDIAHHSEVVAAAMRAHAIAFDPDTVSGIHLPAGDASPETEDQAIVLAALVQQVPGTEHLAKVLGDNAFSGEERQDIFHAVQVLTRDGLDIDRLTVDWEAARLRGACLEPAVPGEGPTYVSLLARQRVKREAVLQAAAKLAQPGASGAAPRSASRPARRMPSRLRLIAPPDVIPGGPGPAGPL